MPWLGTYGSVRGPGNPHPYCDRGGSYSFGADTQGHGERGAHVGRQRCRGVHGVGHGVSPVRRAPARDEDLDGALKAAPHSVVRTEPQLTGWLGALSGHSGQTVRTVGLLPRGLPANNSFTSMCGCSTLPQPGDFHVQLPCHGG